MKMLEYQNSAVAKMVQRNPVLRLISKSSPKKSMFGDSSPTMIGVGLGHKIGEAKPTEMKAGKSKAFKAMKFMFNRIGA